MCRPMTVQRPERAVYWSPILATAWQNIAVTEEAADSAPAGLVELDEVGTHLMAKADFDLLFDVAAQDIAAGGDEDEAKRLLRAAVRTRLIASGTSS